MAQLIEHVINISSLFWRNSNSHCVGMMAEWMGAQMGKWKDRNINSDTYVGCSEKRTDTCLDWCKTFWNPFIGDIMTFPWTLGRVLACVCVRVSVGACMIRFLGSIHVKCVGKGTWTSILPLFAKSVFTLKLKMSFLEGPHLEGSYSW